MTSEEAIAPDSRNVSWMEEGDWNARIPLTIPASGVALMAVVSARASGTVR
jgi:hypothetical protein